MPLYYLQRGRTAEALHAYSHVKEAFQNFTGEVRLCLRLLCKQGRTGVYETMQAFASSELPSPYGMSR